jgi:DNA-binding CsgD family transcriptional regulator
MDTKVPRRLSPHRHRHARGRPSEPTTPTGRTVFSEEAWQRVTRVLRLSARESEILQAVFEDHKESCIAANLGISSHTVHTHLERIYRKLHVSSRVALVVRVFAAYLSKPSG